MKMPTQDEMWAVLADGLCAIGDNVPEPHPPWLQTWLYQVSALTENAEDALLSSSQQRVLNALRELRLSIELLNLDNWADWERALDFLDYSFEHGLTEVP
jgi:hypothetical protein